MALLERDFFSRPTLTVARELLGHRLVREIEGQRLTVTPSLGVSLYPDDGADASSLLKNADQALYRAKELGGGQCNRTCAYRAGLRSALASRK